MKEFWELVDIIENNERCVILKVKPDCAFDMIKLGCFDGDEEMIRYARDSDETITVFLKDGKHYSWSRCTLVTESMRQRRIMITRYVKDWCNEN